MEGPESKPTFKQACCMHARCPSAPSPSPCLQPAQDLRQASETPAIDCRARDPTALTSTDLGSHAAHMLPKSPEALCALRTGHLKHSTKPPGPQPEASSTLARLLCVDRDLGIWTDLCPLHAVTEPCSTPHHCTIRSPSLCRLKHQLRKSAVPCMHGLTCKQMGAVVAKRSYKHHSWDMVCCWLPSHMGLLRVPTSQPVQTSTHCTSCRRPATRQQLCCVRQ